MGGMRQILQTLLTGFGALKGVRFNPCFALLGLAAGLGLTGGALFLFLAFDLPESLTAQVLDYGLPLIVFLAIAGAVVPPKGVSRKDKS